MKPKIIVIDGHDGTGKTTIAKKLAKELDGVYIKPFDGIIGDIIVWLYERKKYKLLNKISFSILEKCIEENNNANYLIFDRHWLSIYTLLPSKYYNEEFNFPYTILCTANSKTIIQRLRERNNKEEMNWDNDYFRKKYLEIANNYDLKIIDTSTINIENCINIILEDYHEK